MYKSFICKDKVLQPDVEDPHELGDHKHQKGDDYTKPPLQPDGGDDEEDGKHNDEEVEDEDAGERGGKLVHHQGEPELSYTALIFMFLVV